MAYVFQLLRMSKKNKFAMIANQADKSKIKDIAKMELFEPKSYFFKEDFINDLPF